MTASLAAVMAAGLYCSFLKPDKGPIYVDRYLSDLVVDIAIGHHSSSNAWMTLQGADASTHPYLVKWILHEEKPWRYRTGLWVAPILGSKLKALRLTQSRADLRASGAMQALVEYRTNLSPEIVNELVRLSVDESAPQTARRAEAVLSLIHERAHTNSMVR